MVGLRGRFPQDLERGWSVGSLVLPGAATCPSGLPHDPLCRRPGLIHRSSPSSRPRLRAEAVEIRWHQSGWGRRRLGLSSMHAGMAASVRHFEGLMGSLCRRIEALRTGGQVASVSCQVARTDGFGSGFAQELMRLVVRRRERHRIAGMRLWPRGLDGLTLEFMNDIESSPWPASSS